MEYFLIAFIIAVALAPLTHFLPTRRQREVARMREKAAVQGLFVEFRELPQDARSRADGLSAGEEGGSVTYYGKRMRPARHGHDVRGVWVVDKEGWRGLAVTEPVPDILADLPGTVLAASVDEGSCGIYWREAGAEPEVEQIITVIRSWANELRP